MDKSINKYSHISNAISNLSHRVKLGVIFMGDDGKFWVTSFAYGQVLTKKGYEMAIY